MTLDTLPDDALQEIFAACSTADGVALLDQVIGLACLSRGMQRQLHRLRPLVGVHVRSLTVEVVDSNLGAVWMSMVGMQESGGGQASSGGSQGQTLVLCGCRRG